MIRSQIIGKIESNLRQGSKSGFTRRELVDGINGELKNHKESLIFAAFERRDLEEFLELLGLFGNGFSNEDGVSASEVFTYQYGSQRSALVLDKILSTKPENCKSYYTYLGKTLETFGSQEKVIKALESYQIINANSSYNVRDKTIFKAILEGNRADIIRYIASMGDGRSFYEREISLDNNGNKSSIIDYVINNSKKTEKVLDLILRDSLDVIASDNNLSKALGKWAESSSKKASGKFLMQKILKAIVEKDMSRLGSFFKSCGEDDKINLMYAIKEAVADDGKLSHFYQSLDSSSRLDLQNLVGYKGSNTTVESHGILNATNATVESPGIVNVTNSTVGNVTVSKAKVEFETMTSVIASEEAKAQVGASTWYDVGGVIDWVYERVPVPTTSQTFMTSIVASSGNAGTDNLLTSAAMGASIAKDGIALVNFATGDASKPGTDSPKSRAEKLIDVGTNLVTIGVDLYGNLHNSNIQTPAGFVSFIAFITKSFSYVFTGFERDQKVKTNIHEIRVRTDYDKTIEHLSQVNSYIKSSMGYFVLQVTTAAVEYNQNSRYIDQLGSKGLLDNQVKIRQDKVTTALDKVSKLNQDEEQSKEIDNKLIAKSHSFMTKSLLNFIDLKGNLQREGYQSWGNEDGSISGAFDIFKLKSIADGGQLIQANGQPIQANNEITEAGLYMVLRVEGKLNKEIKEAVARDFLHKSEEYALAKMPLLDANNARDAAYGDLIGHHENHLNFLYSGGVIAFNVMIGKPKSYEDAFKLAQYHTVLAAIPMAIGYLGNSGYDNLVSVIDLSVNSYFLAQSKAGNHKLHMTFYAMNFLKGFYKPLKNFKTAFDRYDALNPTKFELKNTQDYIAMDKLYNSQKVELRDQLYVSFNALTTVVSTLAPLALMIKSGVEEINDASGTSLIKKMALPVVGLVAVGTIGLGKFAYDQGYKVISYIAPAAINIFCSKITKMTASKMKVSLTQAETDYSRFKDLNDLDRTYQGNLQLAAESLSKVQEAMKQSAPFDNMILISSYVALMPIVVGFVSEYSRYDSVSSNSEYSKSFRQAFNATDASYKYDYISNKYQIDNQKDSKAYILDKAETLIKDLRTSDNISEIAKNIWDAIDEEQYMSNISGSTGNFNFWSYPLSRFARSSYEQRESENPLYTSRITGYFWDLYDSVGREKNEAIYQRAKKFFDLKILLEVFEDQPERKLKLVDIIGKQFLGGDFRGFNQLEDSDKKLELFTKVMDFIDTLLKEDNLLNANPESLKDIIDSRLSYYIFENFIYTDEVKPKEFREKAELSRNYFDIAIDLVKLAYKVLKGEDLPYDRSQSKSLNLYNMLMTQKTLTPEEKEQLYTSILADKKGFDDIKAVVAHCKSESLEFTNLDKDLHLYRFKNDYESFVSYINDTKYQYRTQYDYFVKEFNSKNWACIRDYQTKAEAKDFNLVQSKVSLTVIDKDNTQKTKTEYLEDFTVRQLYEEAEEGYSYKEQITNLHNYYRNAQTALVDNLASLLRYRKEGYDDQNKFENVLTKLQTKVKDTEGFISKLYGKPALKYTYYEGGFCGYYQSHIDNVISKELGGISNLKSKEYHGYEKIVKNYFELSKEISEKSDAQSKEALKTKIYKEFREAVNNYYAVFEKSEDVTNQSMQEILEGFAKLDSTGKQSECLKKRDLITDAAKFVARDIYKKYEEYKMIGSISPKFANCFDREYKAKIGNYESIFEHCLVTQEILLIESQNQVYDIFDC